MKHLLALTPLLPSHISAASLRPSRRSIAAALFSIRDTAYEAFERAVEDLLDWLFSAACVREARTGCDPRIRAWFAPDDVRKSSRAAVKTGPQPPTIPNRSTSASAVPGPTASLDSLIEFELSEKEKDWAPEKWVSRAEIYRAYGGSTPDLLFTGSALRSSMSTELRTSTSNSTVRPTRVNQPLDNLPHMDTSELNRADAPGSPLVVETPGRGASHLIGTTPTPRFRPARSLKNICSFGDLKSAAKCSFGQGEQQRRREITPPVPKVEDWQRQLANAPPLPPTTSSAAFEPGLQTPPGVHQRQASGNPLPPMSSPPRKPLPAVPSGPPREMPRLKTSHSMELLRNAGLSGQEITRLRAASNSPVSDQQGIRRIRQLSSASTVSSYVGPATPNSGTSSAAVSLTDSVRSRNCPRSDHCTALKSSATAVSSVMSRSSSNLSTRSAPLPPIIPLRHASLNPPPRPTSRPSLPSYISSTTYGQGSDMVLKFLYPEGNCNVLLRVPRTAALADIKARVQEKLAALGRPRLPASAADWSFAYSSTWSHNSADVSLNGAPRYGLPGRASNERFPGHSRATSTSTTGSSNYTRSSLSSSITSASTTLTTPSYGSRRSSVFAMITTESDWKDAIASWCDGKVVLRIMC